MLYGTSDAEPQTDIIVAQLAQELYNTNLLLLLIQVSKHLSIRSIKLSIVVLTCVMSHTFAYRI